MRALPAVLAALAAAAWAADPPAPSPSPTPAGRSTAAPAPDKKEASPSPRPKGKAAEPAAKKGGRTYTNQDIPATPSPVPVPSPGRSGRGSVSEVGTPAGEIREPTPEPPLPDDQREDHWADRAALLRQAIVEQEANVAALEQKVGGLRDDRNPTNLMDPNREQTRRAQIAEAQAELEAARIALEAARQALVDLEEEARRKNVPPGWLRER